MHWKMKLLSIGIIMAIVASLFMASFYVKTVKSESGPIRVACVGDSITERSWYPVKLRLLLGDNYTVANFGVSGSTVSLDSKIPYMNQTEFQMAIQFQPDIVIIMLGTNDANPEITQNETNFEADYTQLVTSFERLEGEQLIWVVKSPPICTNNSNYNNTYLTNTVIPHIDDLANQMNLPTIDINSAFGNHSDYFADGVHPNIEGADLIASHVYDAITLPDGSPDTSCFNDGYSG
jgi:lysophospholipase L1-like esterase